VHFDRQGMMDDYVVHYVKSLFDNDFEILMVSTAPSIGADELEKVRPYCREIIVRENIGHDFGSWKVGLEEIAALSKYDRLLIANDSVYGPFHNLSNLFSEMAAKNLDVWGIADSIQLDYHIQSYFMVFEKPVLESRVFQQFWHTLPYFYRKRVIIWDCEVGLSQRLLHSGFALGALCEYEHLLSEQPDAVQAAVSRGGLLGGPANMNNNLWKVLLEQYRCPFLKIELLRDNPKNLTDLYQWRSVLRQSSSYDCDLIRRHLTRMNFPES